jgi:hypothetical protein
MLCSFVSCHGVAIFPLPATKPYRTATPTNAFLDYVPILFHAASSFFVLILFAQYQWSNRNFPAPEQVRCRSHGAAIMDSPLKSAGEASRRAPYPYAFAYPAASRPAIRPKVAPAIRPVPLA